MQGSGIAACVSMLEHLTVQIPVQLIKLLMDGVLKSPSHLQGDNGALIMVVKAATEHHALLAELPILAIKEVVFLVVGLPEAGPQLMRHPVMRLFVGQPQLDLHLRPVHK